MLWTFNFRFDKQPDPAYVKAFEQYGPCNVSKTATGSVLIKYQNVADAKAAVENLNNTIIDKNRHPVMVDYAARGLKSLQQRVRREAAPQFTIRMENRKKIIFINFFRLNKNHRNRNRRVLTNRK